VCCIGVLRCEDPECVALVCCSGSVSRDEGAASAVERAVFDSRGDSVIYLMMGQWFGRGIYSACYNSFNSSRLSWVLTTFGFSKSHLGDWGPCIYVYVYTLAHICMLCIYTCLCVCVCVCVCVCICIHRHTYRHTYMKSIYIFMYHIQKYLYVVRGPPPIHEWYAATCGCNALLLHCNVLQCVAATRAPSAHLLSEIPVNQNENSPTLICAKLKRSFSATTRVGFLSRTLLCMER